MRARRAVIPFMHGIITNSGFNVAALKVARNPVYLAFLAAIFVPVFLVLRKAGRSTTAH